MDAATLIAMSSSKDALAQRLDDVPLSIRTSNIVHALGVKTVGDLARVSAADLLRSESGDRRVVFEVRRLLAEHGFSLSATARAAIRPRRRGPEYDWGCLHVFEPVEGADARVRAEVLEVYRQRGVAPAAWSDPDEVEAQFGRIGPLEMNLRAELGDDDVFVLPEAEPGWIAIASCRWEWAPIAAHPLAIALSHAFDVLSTSSHRDRYAEVTRYRGGRAIESTVVGPDVPARPHDCPPVDLTWFADKGAVMSAPELADFVLDIDRFVALAGPDTKGLRDLFEAAPLSCYPRESYLVLRR